MTVSEQVLTLTVSSRLSSVLNSSDRKVITRWDALHLMRLSAKSMWHSRTNLSRHSSRCKCPQTWSTLRDMRIAQFHYTITFDLFFRVKARQLRRFFHRFSDPNSTGDGPWTRFQNPCVYWCVLISAPASIWTDGTEQEVTLVSATSGCVTIWSSDDIISSYKLSSCILLASELSSPGSLELKKCFSSFIHYLCSGRHWIDSWNRIKWHMSSKDRIEPVNLNHPTFPRLIFDDIKTEEFEVIRTSLMGQKRQSCIDQWFPQIWNAFKSLHTSLFGEK